MEEQLCCRSGHNKFENRRSRNARSHSSIDVVVRAISENFPLGLELNLLRLTHMPNRTILLRYWCIFCTNKYYRKLALLEGMDNQILCVCTYYVCTHNVRCTYKRQGLARRHLRNFDSTFGQNRIILASENLVHLVRIFFLHRMVLFNFFQTF